MDYLDPKKRFRHHVMLMIGYVLIGIAIVIGTFVLLYQAYGFGLGRNGDVIQNGLFFFSSQPSPADIYVNGTKKSVQTNTRLSLPAGIYGIRLEREGYRDWQRTIALEGGSVQHVDYPFLIPKTLSSKKVQSYAAAPGLVTQSPDRRWLLVQQAGTMTGFEVHDLKNPAKAPETLSLPAGVVTAAAGAQSLQAVEWAGDNRHLLLRHDFDGRTEFILLDRADPAQSVNLNTLLSLNPARITLRDKKYDRYYIYGTAGGALSTAELKNPAAQPFLERVLAYKSYGDDTMLYATEAGAPAGKVQVKLRIGDKTSVIKTFPAGATYLLDLTKYDGEMYVAAGAASENKVYIFQDPSGQIAANPGKALVPTQVLRVSAPNHLSFSNSAQFVMIESGPEFAVYDIENEAVFRYTSPFALDPPQAHAGWMDGNRLTYVSGGKLVIFDYDDTNRQVLVPAAGQFEPAFTPDYEFLYTVAPAANGSFDLNQTSLLTPADR